MFADAARSGDVDVDKSILCETDRIGRHTAEVGATRPSGRILPSLVESPWTVAPVEATSRRRTRGEIAKEAAVGKPTPVDGRLTVGREEPDGQTDARSMTETSVTPRQVVQAPSRHVPTTHSSSEAELSPQAGRGAVMSTASGPPRGGRQRTKEKKDLVSGTVPAPIDAEAALEEPPSDALTRDDDASRRRHRFIMARYVFGTQLKPGERWRQRMRHMR